MTTIEDFRMKFIDGDYRRDPRTDHYCCRCQKDLKTGQKFREVHLVNGGAFVLHPDDEQRYQEWSSALPGGQHRGELGFHAIGMDCARKIGIEWTHEARQ